MVADGVYYESYVDYSALFRNWLITYMVVLLLPACVVVWRRFSRKTLWVRGSLVCSLVLALGTLPFALVAESYFAYQEFVELCRTEAALKIYQPIPEYTRGYAIDVGDDAAIRRVAECNSTCRYGLEENGYDFVEQVSFGILERPHRVYRMIEGRADGTYYYVPPPEPEEDIKSLRVYHFTLVPVGTPGCDEKRGHTVRWYNYSREHLFCVNGERRDNPISLHRIVFQSKSVGCCIGGFGSSSYQTSSGIDAGRYQLFQYATANYMKPFFQMLWPNMSAGMFHRCSAQQGEVRFDVMLPLLVGYPKDRKS